MDQQDEGGGGGIWNSRTIIWDYYSYMEQDSDMEQQDSYMEQQESYTEQHDIYRTTGQSY